MLNTDTVIKTTILSLYKCYDKTQLQSNLPFMLVCNTCCISKLQIFLIYGHPWVPFCPDKGGLTVLRTRVSTLNKHCVFNLKGTYERFHYCTVSLPSSSIICIIAFRPSMTPLVMEGLLKKRPYCSVISRATLSLIIVKLGSL